MSTVDTLDSYRQELLDTVGEILGDKVQPDDHFLDVRGDSLTAAIINDRLIATRGRGVELSLFFESETLGELADHWASLLTEAQAAESEAVNHG
ncbi:acyl carrier protein [Crossiella sp. CA-258035]|uniref:acyl carrier protein n=1 Tax=Crossiella sp. CA-258035 TaxID=2981138 RepID=UPI0024BC3AD6|nr:acyl carrier protein [Crossiella sp. CA-258035]WHT16233.1 acyl carrier protein [Crossiella sp. CA-258035]